MNLGETTTTLLPEYGEPIQLSSAFFLRLLEARTIVIPKGETEEQVRQAPVSERTVRRWAQAYQAAALHYRTGYVGLLPKTSMRGNRHAKAPEEAQALLLSFITDG